MPTSLDNGQRSPKKFLRSVVARLARAEGWESLTPTVLDEEVGYQPGMDGPWLERTRQIDETLSVLRQANPRNQPTVEDIARLHELHARHEREAGREGSAVVAEERARNVRART